MITRHLLRPSTALRTAAWTCRECLDASAALPSRTWMAFPLQAVAGRRRLQTLPRLTHHKTFSVDGIPGLLGPGGYAIAWEQYMQMMLNKINMLTAGEPYENVEIRELALMFARDPMAASLFNHASMAHNNHFFFQSFSTSPAKLHHFQRLEENLLATFGSIETLRTTFRDTAAAMFGPGFVWLVWAKDLNAPASSLRRGTWRILTTYLAGTPYPEAGYRQQGLDASTNNADTYQQYMSGAKNDVGMFGSNSRQGKDQAKLPPGGTTLVPVLCVNTWEHVYIRDFGVNGKGRYLDDWWDCIDWYIVEGRAPKEAKGETPFPGRGGFAKSSASN